MVVLTVCLGRRDLIKDGKPTIWAAVKKNQLSQDYEKKVFIDLAVCYIFQRVEKKTRELACLEEVNLILINRGNLAEEEKGTLKESDHIILGFKVLQENLDYCSTCTLDFKRTNFNKFRKILILTDLIEIFTSNGVQEDWELLKNKIPEVQLYIILITGVNLGNHHNA